MAFALVSLVALAVIAAAVAVAWSKRFIAYGALAIGNIIVFVLTAFGPTKNCVVLGQTRIEESIHCDLALHGGALASFEPVAFLQLFTHMFVHADFMHLFGNLLILLAFSVHFEDRIGSRAFVALYLLTGLAAAAFQAATAWGQIGLMMGASGAVFGIIGAFAAAYPRLVVPLPLPLIVFMMFVRMRVWVAAAVFAGTQILAQQLSSYAPEGGSRVAYFAHLGGLAAGVVFAATYLRARRPEGPVKERIPVARLRPFASTVGARRALEHMETNLDERSVFDAWRERFFRHATCPTCEKPVRVASATRLTCENGHSFDLRGPVEGPAAA